MRAGERGSISPAGDLIAFGIALAIVVGLSGILPLMFSENESDDGVDPGAISAFLAWSGWDRDGDGILELQNIEELPSYATIALDGSYWVSVSVGERTFGFFFRDGKVSSDAPAPDLGITHSASILIRSGDRTILGLMAISEVRS
jgi:hypothetical protein